MAKADPRPLALEALCKALADPQPKVLHGSAKVPGIFKGGSQAEKTAARLCLDENWLEPTGEAAGKGKTKKDLYRVTAQGIREALENTEPVTLVRHLLPALQENQQTLRVLREQLGGMNGLLEALTTAVNQLAQKTIVPNLEQLLAKMQADRPATETLPPAASSDTGFDWFGEVVKMAQEQKQRNPYQRLTLSQIYERLKTTQPSLTLGRFHDGLRTLQEQRRIQLGPYTQALATLDDARNALYLDREVKYYVDLP